MAPGTNGATAYHTQASSSNTSPEPPIISSAHSPPKDHRNPIAHSRLRRQVLAASVRFEFFHVGKRSVLRPSSSKALIFQLIFAQNQPPNPAATGRLSQSPANLYLHSNSTSFASSIHRRGVLVSSQSSGRPTGCGCAAAAYAARIAAFTCSSINSVFQLTISVVPL